MKLLIREDGETLYNMNFRMDTEFQLCVMNIRMEAQKIETPVAFDQEIRSYIKQEKLSQFEIPIVKYTLYENDADRISALQQACVGKAHPFFSVVKENKEEQIIHCTLLTIFSYRGSTNFQSLRG